MVNLAGSLAIFATVLATAALLGANEVGYFLATVVAAAVILTGRRFWVDKRAQLRQQGGRMGCQAGARWRLGCIQPGNGVGKVFNPNLGLVEAGFHKYGAFWRHLYSYRHSIHRIGRHWRAISALR